MTGKKDLQAFKNIKMDYENITEDEIESWIVTSRDVICILKEEGGKTYKKVLKEFLQDLEELEKYKRITQEDINEVTQGL